jgi:hypothetical protein
MSTRIVTDADLLVLRDTIDTILVTWASGLPETGPDTPPPPPNPINTWSTGAFTEHKKTVADAWFANIMRRPGQGWRHVCAFVTHNQDEAKLTNNWWAACVPGGTGLSLRIPLVPKNDTDLKKDRSATWRTIARQAAAVDPDALICPGWEMNLPGWAHRVTSSNLSAWRDAWTRCYDVMKAEAPGLVIGFNPNGGPDQTGVDIRKVWVDGKIDAAGPDQYDCWPGMTSDANTAKLFEQPGGLNFWQDWTFDHDVALIVPEWGVSSGTQWAGHTGGDNPNYIRKMWEFFQASPNLLMETYFNEGAGYLKSDLLFGQNPKAGALYKELWSTLP